MKIKYCKCRTYSPVVGCGYALNGESINPITPRCYKCGGWDPKLQKKRKLNETTNPTNRNGHRRANQ